MNIALAFLPIFALLDTTAISESAWASVITALTNQFNVSSVVGVLASLAGAAIGLVFIFGKALSLWRLGFSYCEVIN